MLNLFARWFAKVVIMSSLIDWSLVLASSRLSRGGQGGGWVGKGGLCGGKGVGSVLSEGLNQSVPDLKPPPSPSPWERLERDEAERL